MAIDFTIGLSIRNKDMLEKLFWQVSNPDAPNYKEYMQVEEIAQHFGHSRSSLEPLLRWLKNSFAPATVSLPITMNAIFVRNAPVERVQKVFGIALREVISEEGTHLLRCVDTIGSCELHVPSDLGTIVQLIEGIADFPPSKQLSFSPVATDINITPKELFAQYSVPKQVSVNCNRTAQAVAEFSGSNFVQSYNPVDLSTFQTTYNLLVQPVSKLYGVNTPSEPTGEASLDIQYVMAMAQGVPTWFWGETGSFLNYLIHVANEPNGPLVHSISYSIGDEDDLSRDHMDLLNQHFQMIALRGISLIWASGDDGTGNTGVFGCGEFVPGFPASSPYVTSVGATSFTKGSSSSPQSDLPFEQHAATYSGGGFSNTFPRPAYQDLFVKNYFAENKNTLPPAQYYNASGRGYPDVAVAGTNFLIFVGGFTGPPMPASGTSASTPVFSAMLTLINNDLMAAGKKSVGFVNPALYRSPTSVWQPITQGSNQYWPCDSGFTAAAPWAPISGLGSPYFPALRSYFLSYGI